MEASARIKTQQRGHWDTVAAGWGAWLEWTERSFEPLTSWLAGAVGWNPGACVLDVACGAGYPALAAARAVGPRGRVVAVDLSPEMVAIASGEARRAELGHVAFEVMDAESLTCEPAAFEGVTNAYGLMFCPEPARALAESRRMLVPGGRIAVVVWDEPAKNPFFTAIRGPAERFLALQPPAPDGPGPFRLASPAVLRTLLEEAGFTAVRVETLPLLFEFSSVSEYVQLLTDFAWKSKVAALSAEERARFHDAVAEAARPFWDGGRLRLLATSLCAAGSA